jgi:hypothetical protein
MGRFVPGEHTKVNASATAAGSAIVVRTLPAKIASRNTQIAYLCALALRFEQEAPMAIRQPT